MSGGPLDHDSPLNVLHSAGSPTPAVASPFSSSPPTTPPAASSPRMAFRGPIRRYDSTLSNGQPYHRGSSNEFETFDELLRAAGYKETRVVSPEMERQEILEQETQERSQRQRSFVENYGPLTGRVAHFLSTYIVPAKANSSFLEPTSPAHGLSESPKDDRPPISFSTSPRDNRRRSHHPDDHPSVLSLDSSSASSSAHLTATPKHREPVPQVIASPTTAFTHTPRPIAPSPNRSSRTRHLRTTASFPHLRPPRVDDATSRITPATTALRHAQRQSRPRQSSNRTGRQPLPDTWLDAFAKAVLGSRVSSPNATRRNSPRKSSGFANRRNANNTAGGSTNSNSWGRKSGSLPGRNSSVNLRGGGRAIHSSNRAADKLLARSHSSGSAIVSTSKTRVVCRSSSTGRHNYSGGGYGSDSSRGGTRTPILSPARERDPLWGDAGSSPPVPSLPATYAAFSTQIPPMRMTRTKMTIMTNRSSVTDDEWYEYADDEDEPHLSNIFVPVSRQRSIQSLRACLDKHAQGTAALYLHPDGRPIRERVRNPLFRNASYGQFIHRQNSGFEEDEDEVNLRGRIGTSWSHKGKNRGGKRGKVIWGWGEDDV